MSKILKAARELFGKQRYEEICGELWLRLPAIRRSIARGVTQEVALKRWENNFKRCTEEGRYREGRNGRRRRVARFSELEERGRGPGEDPLREVFCCWPPGFGNTTTTKSLPHAQIHS